MTMSSEPDLARREFGADVSEETYILHRATIDALRAMGFAVEDSSYRNDTDVSVAVYEGSELNDSDEPRVTLFVVDPDSELAECDAPVWGVEEPWFAPIVCDQWPGGVYVSGEQIARAKGVPFSPQYRTLQEVASWLRLLDVATLREVAERIAQNEVE